jgi:hypothetical protein
MPVITCIEDLRVLAEKRVPRMFYDPKYRSCPVPRAASSMLARV